MSEAKKSPADLACEVQAPLEAIAAPVEPVLPAPPAPGDLDAVQISRTAFRSRAFGALACALAAAQAEMGPAIKDKVNEAFRKGRASGKYADLAAYREVWRPAGPPRGLAIMCLPNTEGGKAVAMTILLAHGPSGQWITNEIEIPAQYTAHGIGSAETYAERYAFRALVGIAPDEDDDGNGSTNGKPERHDGETYRRAEPAPEPEREATFANPDLRKKANSALAVSGPRKFGGDDLGEAAFYLWLGNGGFPFDEAKGRASITLASDAQVINAGQRLRRVDEATISRLRQTAEATAA